MSEKIGFVGVGRMGANMARRLKDCDFDVVAVFDSYADSASTLAAEIGAKHCHTLPEVTALSDVIFTVVTDDAAMLEIFGDPESSLLQNADHLVEAVRRDLALRIGEFHRSPAGHAELVESCVRH